MVVVVVGSVTAWPIAPPDNNGITASDVIFLSECGASVEKSLSPTQPLQVFFNVTSSPTEECQIFLRVFVKDIGLAKYGLSVFGHLHLNNDDCSSSSLLLHDNDDDTDPAAISRTYCGSGPVEYRTVEDVIIFSYKQRGSVGWQGAAMRVVPELVCGGDVTKDTTLAIHHYNFAAPYVCNWRLLPGEGQVAKLTFEAFNLTPPKRNKCTTEGVQFIPGDMKHYCGKQLMEYTKYLSGTELMYLRVTRKSTEFKCRVEYVPDRRYVDHLPQGVH